MSRRSEEVEPVVFNAGDILFCENEVSYHFYIIKEGNIEVYKTGSNGTKVPLAVVGPATSIGEFAMIDRLPRSATAAALTEVKAIKVSDIAYQELLKDLPEWAVAVMRALVERLRQTNELIRKGFVDAETRTQIQHVEFEPENDTVLDSHPFLQVPSDNDEDEP